MIRHYYLICFYLKLLLVTHQIWSSRCLVLRENVLITDGKHKRIGVEKDRMKTQRQVIPSPTPTAQSTRLLGLPLLLV